MSKSTPTKASVQAEFEALVENDSFWSRFVGSQFVSMLVLFITQLVYRCYQYADAALAEGFISTATRRHQFWPPPRRTVMLVLNRPLPLALWRSL